MSECPDDGTYLSTRKMKNAATGRMEWMGWCWRCGRQFSMPDANPWWERGPNPLEPQTNPRPPTGTD